ncbi:MAG: CDP-diacylglycerol--glycerol-3-phosphate 3-phosphatidyltransferase [Anaerorhabdus sp.]
MNLPNRLTVIRILMIPFMMLIWLFPYAQVGINVPDFQLSLSDAAINVSLSIKNLVCLGVFLLAAFTDYLDGAIARKNNLVTTFGKFADPIADKLLVSTMFVLFVADGIIPVVPVALMIMRDTVVDGCRMLAAQNGVVVAAGYLGKVKTAIQMVTIVLILLNNLPFEFYRLPVSDFMLWFAALISLASGLAYFNQLKEYIFESK